MTLYRPHYRHAIPTEAAQWSSTNLCVRLSPCSGTIDTPILDPLGPEAKERFNALIPRGEMGRPEEIATVALFLASSDSSFVNGVELFVDGGAAQI